MKKRGFTLAEVLITLGIIGIVAAMTLPTVIQKHQKQVTVQRLKKVYAVLNQAFKLSESDNGEFAYWDSKNDIGATRFFEKYWKPYLNNPVVCETYQECGYKESKPWQTLKGGRKGEVSATDNLTDNRISFKLPDGTFISLSDNIYIDLNGSQKPNIYGKDFFVFTYNDKGIMPSHYNAEKSFIITRCSKNNNYDAACCAARLIMLDNWEIKADYPW